MGRRFTKRQEIVGNPGVFGQASSTQKRTFFSTNSNTDSEKLYNILEVSKSATDSEIKKSFFNLAKKYHPDVNKTKEAKVKYL